MRATRLGKSTVQRVGLGNRNQVPTAVMAITRRNPDAFL